MGLKDLFDDIIIFNDIEGSSDQSEKCVKICENFAIRFAEWYSSKDEYFEYGKTIKELLEIFKKEKGL